MLVASSHRMANLQSTTLSFASQVKIVQLIYLSDTIAKQVFIYKQSVALAASCVRCTKAIHQLDKM